MRGISKAGIEERLTLSQRQQADCLNALGDVGYQAAKKRQRDYSANGGRDSAGASAA